ncbi:MAG: hypothetical protein P1P86_15180 [Bacteroidales bacterium]|nr:hypothetical protein [Bacteroidales bacterium]
MPANSKPNTQNQDEIDLLTLFTKLGEFIKNSILWLVSLIGSVLVFLLRKWYYFTVAILLTILSAYILNKAVEPVYSSDLIMRSNATTNQPIMSSLNKLGSYASERNIAALSGELGLSEEDASKIKGLETFWLYDIGNDGIYDGIDINGSYLSDTSVVKLENEFVIRTSVLDPGVLETLENSLVNYLETKPYLITLNKQRLAELEAQLKQTSYEIEKLDSLQKREYYTNPDHLRQQEGQVVFTSEKTVRTFHDDMFRLLELKQECERDLNIYSEVATVIEGFSIPKNPENGSVNYLKMLIWYFLGFALLLSVIITFRKKIWPKL